MRGFNSASIATIAAFAKSNDEGISQDMQETIDSVKAAFKATEKRSLKISDTALAHIIGVAGDKWEELEEDEAGMLAFLKGKEEQASQVAIADPGITALVSKLDAEFHEELAKCVDAVVKNKSSAVDMYAQLCRVWTMEELDGCPMPGTDKDDVAGTNYAPDKKETPLKTGGSIKTVWTNDFVSFMPEGKELETVLDDISKETKTAGSVPRFKSKGKADLDSLKASITQKRNAIRSMLKRAIKFHHQWRAIEAMPKVGIAWLPPMSGDASILFPEPKDYGKQMDIEDLTKGKHVKASGAPKPVYLWTEDVKPPVGRIVSVTQLNAFNVAEAIAMGGTLANLVETGGKGADDSEDGTGDGSDWDVDTIEVTTSQVVNALNNRATMALVLKKIANKKGQGNDLLDNLCSLHLATKQLYEKNKSAYEALQVRPDAEEAAA